MCQLAAFIQLQLNWQLRGVNHIVPCLTTSTSPDCNASHLLYTKEKIQAVWVKEKEEERNQRKEVDFGSERLWRVLLHLGLSQKQFQSRVILFRPWFFQITCRHLPFYCLSWLVTQAGRSSHSEQNDFTPLYIQPDWLHSSIKWGGGIFTFCLWNVRVYSMSSDFK